MVCAFSPSIYSSSSVFCNLHVPHLSLVQRVSRLFHYLSFSSLGPPPPPPPRAWTSCHCALIGGYAVIYSCFVSSFIFYMSNSVSQYIVYICPGFSLSMSLYLYRCVRISISIYIYVYVSVCVYICMCICIHVGIYIQYIYMYIYVYVCICLYFYVYLSIYLSVYMFFCI